MLIFFLIWLIFAGVCDAVYRKSFNYVSLIGIVVGLGNLLMGSSLGVSEISGFAASILAFSVLLIFYKYGVIAAGDVKFAAALGIWVGLQRLIPIWVISCLFTVLHGLFFKYRMLFLFKSDTGWDAGSIERSRFIPYVTYLSLSTVLTLIWEN